MRLTINFYSYFKDLTGCANTTVEIPEGNTVEDVFQYLMTKFPRLVEMKKSTLIAVGVEYQTRDHVLKDGDEVSFFPPVQGG